MLALSRPFADLGVSFIRKAILVPLLRAGRVKRMNAMTIVLLIQLIEFASLTFLWVLPAMAFVSYFTDWIKCDLWDCVIIAWLFNAMLVGLSYSLLFLNSIFHWI